MRFMLALLGCNATLTPGGNPDAPGEGDASSAGPPELALEAPAAAAFLAAGTHAITGRAVAIDAVSVNGSTATRSHSTFSTDLALPVGLTTLEAQGTDADGRFHRDSWSVLAGDFAAPTGTVGDAVQLFVSPEALDALAPLLGDVLDPAALSAQLVALNPVVDTPDARVDLTGVAFGSPAMTLVPGAGVIELTIVVPEFVLGIEATIPDALPFGIDLTLEPDLRADEVSITTTLDVAPDGRGGLVAAVGPLDVSLDGFDLDTGILELVDWLFIDDDDLAVMLERQLTGLGSALGPTIDDLLAGLDLSVETELLGTALAVAPSFDRVDIAPSGIGLGLGVRIDVDGADPDVPGHLSFPPPPQGRQGELYAQVSDAFLNRALFELWAGGALDLELDLDADDAAILFLFGGAGTGKLSMASALPPAWLEVDGETRMQLGEVALTVDTPGGQYGDRLELVMALDARAELSVTSAAAGVVLSDARVKMRTTGDSVGNEVLEAKLEDLATAFGIGIGVVNELLSFPLTDLLGPDVELPPLALDRDPSALGLAVELSVADLLPLLGVTVPPPPPPAPTSPVPIPPTATVFDADAEVTVDGTEGWVCRNDDVEVSANAGTWYVDDRGGLVVFGTGHTIFAVDDADVVLEAGGNLVFADPGASVEDLDGANTIVWVDPLELDLASAPAPGCP